MLAQRSHLVIFRLGLEPRWRCVVKDAVEYSLAIDFSLYS